MNVDVNKMKPGQIQTIAGKAYSVCAHCRRLVRIDKPILGSIHLCDP